MEITQSNNAIMRFEEKVKMSESIARSGLFGLKNPDQALVLMGICEATGMHPMKACQDYHIINGKPSLTADAMLARFQQSGGKVRWNTYTDTKVEGVFSHPQGGEITVDWTLERARNAGLNSPNWKKFPRNMLRARVVSEAIRAIFPAIVSGTYTPEEVAEFDNPEPAPAPTPAEPATATDEQVEGFWKAIKENGLEDFVSSIDKEFIDSGITKPQLNGIYKAAAKRKVDAEEVVDAEVVEPSDVDEMMGGEAK